MITTSELYTQIAVDKRFFLIAGPCVIESEAILFQIAEFLVKATSERGITLIFKASYQKANRTSDLSYSGLGLEAGLCLLQKVKDTFQVPILTDIHETTDVSAVAQVCDVIQIPAFLSRQTALIKAAAASGKIVNIKKGQFMAPEDMQAALTKAVATGNHQVLLTERGTSFGYHNLVVDFRSFAIMKAMQYPVIYDVTHSLQQPSLGNSSGGTPQYVPMMAAAAMATGCVDGLFIETHPAPQTALSDAASMLALDRLPAVLDRCIQVRHS
jgi:2-dehydro-3-deoxyphosphooctonate aldolase (KDO 8-P synthase)